MEQTTAAASPVAMTFLRLLQLLDIFPTNFGDLIIIVIGNEIQNPFEYINMAMPGEAKQGDLANWNHLVRFGFPLSQ